jgi:hypothetical protein
VNGTTVTGGWIATALPAYQDLREHTTITTTTTGQNGNQTGIAIVVYPGGTAWWPTGDGKTGGGGSGGM